WVGTWLRIRLHVDPARATGTEHPRNHRSRRLGGGDAVAGTSEAAGCCRNRKRGHESLFQTGRFLHLFVSDPVGRLASQRRAWLVVGRSGGGAGDGTDHHQGRYRRNQGQGVLRSLRVQLKRRRTWPIASVRIALASKRSDRLLTERRLPWWLVQPGRHHRRLRWWHFHCRLLGSGLLLGALCVGLCWWG